MSGSDEPGEPAAGDIVQSTAPIVSAAAEPIADLEADRTEEDDAEEDGAVEEDDAQEDSAEEDGSEEDGSEDDVEEDDVEADRTEEDDAGGEGTERDEVPAAKPDSEPSATAPSAAPAPQPEAPANDSPWGQPAEPADATAELDPGSENMWGTDVEAQQGTLSISTNPDGAVVWLSGKRLGVAPLSTTIDFGNHSIKVELDGYQTESRSIDMQSAAVTVPFELKRSATSGTVHIYGKTGHLIYIDGNPVGTSPVNTTLTPGRHTIRVVAESGTSSSITEEVQFSDATTPFIIDLGN
jgi:hypothetical protein